MDHALPFTENAKEIMANRDNWRHCSPDIPPCGICKNPIYEEIAIRLFNVTDNTEIAFHSKCCFEGSITSEPENEDWINDNMENIFCFYCEDLEKCKFIKESYKGKKVVKKK